MSTKTEAKQICHCFVTIGSTHCVAFRTSRTPPMDWQSLVLNVQKCIHIGHESVHFNLPMFWTQDNLRGSAAEQHSNSGVTGVLPSCLLGSAGAPRQQFEAILSLKAVGQAQSAVQDAGRAWRLHASERVTLRDTLAQFPAVLFWASACMVVHDKVPCYTWLLVAGYERFDFRQLLRRGA